MATEQEERERKHRAALQFLREQVNQPGPGVSVSRPEQRTGPSTGQKIGDGIADVLMMLSGSATPQELRLRNQQLSTQQSREARLEDFLQSPQAQQMFQGVPIEALPARRTQADISAVEEGTRGQSQERVARGQDISAAGGQTPEGRLILEGQIPALQRGQQANRGAEAQQIAQAMLMMGNDPEQAAGLLKAAGFSDEEISGMFPPSGDQALFDEIMGGGGQAQPSASTAPRTLPSNLTENLSAQRLAQEQMMKDLQAQFESALQTTQRLDPEGTGQVPVGATPEPRTFLEKIMAFGREDPLSDESLFGERIVDGKVQLRKPSVPKQLQQMSGAQQQLDTAEQQLEEARRILQQIYGGDVDPIQVLKQLSQQGGQ